MLTVYSIGGTLTSTCGSIIHEVAHSLVFKSPLGNRLLGLLVNTTIPFPIAMSFKRYHLDHHAFQGVLGKDPDLPLDWEINLIRGNIATKLAWLAIYPFMYVIRGIAHQKPPTRWEIINLIWTVVCDVVIYSTCGGLGLLYCFLSLWLGYSLHPGAAHFIQEHYTWIDGQETYSYYGSMNSIMMNVGYHNEHHDFTKVTP